jgi:hypothetical protein
MNGKIKLLLLTVALISGSATPAQRPQVAGQSSSEETLARHVAGAELTECSAVDAFVKALNSAGVSGGSVGVATCERQQNTLLWKPDGSPLRTMLDFIVRADRQYRWEAENDVVNLLPVGGEPELLRLRIARLDVDNVVSAQRALDELMGLPEVRSRMQTLGLTGGLSLLNIPMSPYPRKFSVHCRGVTFREALNAIARAKGHAVWSYAERHCNGVNELFLSF